MSLIARKSQLRQYSLLHTDAVVGQKHIELIQIQFPSLCDASDSLWLKLMSYDKMYTAVILLAWILFFPSIAGGRKSPCFF